MDPSTPFFSIITALLRADTHALAAPLYNALLIMADDLRPAMGCYEQKLLQTPNLDRIAREKQHEANRLVLDYIAAGKNLVYVDLWPDSFGADGLPKPELYVADQLHPSAAGYTQRTKLVRPHLT